MEELLAQQWSMICEHRYELIKRFKEGFGDRFDDLDFMNYETGGYVKGAELRDAQTGCEIQERLGWFKSGFNSNPSFKCGCKQFDEQLCFVSKDGNPLSNTDYCVTLADGRTVSGTTDNDGKTKRIKNTQKEMPIEKVLFFNTVAPFCPVASWQKGGVAWEQSLIGITTTNNNVGSSVKKVTVKGAARDLTAGEIAMASKIFKTSINYNIVKVHKKAYLPFTGNNAMTPNGEMYFPESDFREDFSTEKDEYKIWFIHEMAHVWQYQLGYWIKWNGAWQTIAGGYGKKGTAYKYDPKADKDKSLSEFNFEQQADIIAHYFGAAFLKYKDYTSELSFLESVLKDFLRSPKNAKLLPK